MPKVEIEESELSALKLKLEKAQAGETLWKDKVTSKDKEFEALKATHQAELAKVAEASTREKAFAGKGIEDAKVRRYFELDFEEQRSSKDGEADFGKWLSGLDGEKSPHLAPFLKPAAAAAGQQGGQQQGAQGQQGGQQQGAQGQQGGQQTQRREMPNTNKGAGAGQQGGLTFTPEQLASMTDEQFIAAMPSLRAAHPELAHMIVPGLPTTSTTSTTVAQA